MEITLEEAQVILAITDRVQISGKEAMTIAQLQVKLQNGLKKEETPVEPKKK